jgi:hypothetical protein
MTVYDLYIESGPRHRMTMVHVPQLLGCVTVLPTMSQAMEAAPDTIAAFRRLRHRHGEDLDPDEPVETRIARETTKGLMLDLPTDMVPLSDDAIDHALTQLRWINAELGSWADAQAPAALDEKPGKGLPARPIILHVIASQGGYLESAFGSGPEIAPIRRKAGKGDIFLGEGLLETVERCRERVAQATPEQRRGVRQMPWGPYTLHRALRRLNEHAWEHLSELSRRPGGPAL